MSSLEKKTDFRLMAALPDEDAKRYRISETTLWKRTRRKTPVCHGRRGTQLNMRSSRRPGTSTSGTFTNPKFPARSTIFVQTSLWVCGGGGVVLLEALFSLTTFFMALTSFLRAVYEAIADRICQFPCYGLRWRLHARAEDRLPSVCEGSSRGGRREPRRRAARWPAERRRL